MLQPYSFERAATVTPSDSVDLGPIDGGFPHARGLYISTAGALKVTTAGGDVLTLPGVSAGHLYLAVRRVWATGTTAAGIVALF